MRFGPDDEDAFATRRDELISDFGQWLADNHVERGDAGDAGVALDWKWGYADGELGTWTVAGLQEFLLEWCPRKLSLAPQHCRDFPASIAAFCTFLAARGLLTKASSGLEALQRYCEQHADRFVREMADPSNYGLAKGMFAQAGGLGAELSEQDLDDVLARMQAGFGPDADEEGEPLTAGPVRLPDPDSASAGQYLDLVGAVEAQPWRDEVLAWVARRGAAAAGDELAAALAEPDRPPAVVLVVLAELDGLLGGHAVPAARTLLGGVHDGLAVRYLLGAGALDTQEIGPERVRSAILDVLALALDSGQDMLVRAFDTEAEGQDPIGMIERFWRCEHPRVGELLQALGARHPDKTVAKAARKAAMRHRSYLANR